jgi:predicted dehydrogenase
VKLKAGIIGLGRIASLYEEDARARQYYPYLTHAGSYSKHPSVELVCGADINKKRLKKFGVMWGVNKLYDDYKMMLKENDLDILSICTYSDQHYDIIKSASNCVKVIFCEKPFARNSQEIKSIIKLENRTGVKIAINLYREYDKSHIRIRNSLMTERYGKIQRINCYYGKGLRNMGTHLIGYLIGTLGVPKKINVLSKRMYRGDEEFTYDVHLEFKGGIPALLQSCDFNNYRLFELDFICQKGRIQILDEGLSIKMFEVRKNRAESGTYELIESRRNLKSTIGHALYYAVEHLGELSRDKKMEPIVSPEKYLDLQRVIEEIERQGRNIPCPQN